MSCAPELNRARVAYINVVFALCTHSLPHHAGGPLGESFASDEYRDANRKEIP